MQNWILTDTCKKYVFFFATKIGISILMIKAETLSYWMKYFFIFLKKSYFL